MEINAYRVRVIGIVQGVGFRPFVYNLAKSLFLNGCVSNSGADVLIRVEGNSQKLSVFLDKLKSEAPPLSYIKDIMAMKEEYAGYSGFFIEESSSSEDQGIYISPDVSICEDCRREMLDKENRRFLYPLINCTNCGPRFTIIHGIPYDRANTTMKKFDMCEKCSDEYHDPADRRYHAQPVSCYDCGPQLELLDNKGRKIISSDIISLTRKLLSEGHIVAIKGLGGYHLACSADNAAAVRELRKRKVRDDKPFALMVRDYESALKLCHINHEEKKLLESIKKPIVLLKRRENIGISDEIVSENPYLGIMLPYTPIHLLLFNYQDDEPGMLSTLVMTSGNRSSEPIYYRDEEAVENLSHIADYFLTNNRDIYIRTDDSVTRVFNDKEYIIRRARGYVPFPITCDTGVDKEIIPSVLACGGEMKSTFCMNKFNEFYLSHHIGDLENSETLSSFEDGIEHFRKLFNINFDIAAFDLHPQYLSTKYANELDIKYKIPVQHHHAHIASCMAENNLKGDVIGVAFDGTGYGEDGHLWGGEFFTGSCAGFKREGHLEYIKMPGGEKAVREPWRMAAAYLHKLQGELADTDRTSIKGAAELCSRYDIDETSLNTILQMLEKGINSPMTSSIGRLFDAVAALIGVRGVISYEGQAAIELEYLARPDIKDRYSFKLKDTRDEFQVCVDDMISGILEDLDCGVSSEVIASKFHESVTTIVLEACSHIREKSGLSTVALSGGVFQNITLLGKCVSRLRDMGFDVFTHSRIPTNDGGIALGQAVIAVAQLSK